MIFPFLNNSNFRNISNPSNIFKYRIPILKDSFEEKEQVIGWTVGNPKIKNDGIYADIMIKSDYIDYDFTNCEYLVNNNYDIVEVVCLYFKKEGEDND